MVDGGGGDDSLAENNLLQLQPFFLRNFLGDEDDDIVD